MQRNEFNYTLPPELIAQVPVEPRSASRLLRMNRQSGQISHHQFTDFVDLLNPGDLLVFNDTRVIPARLFGEKETGGKVEILLERLTGGTRAIAQIKASKAPQPDSRIQLDQDISLRVIEKLGDMYLIESQADMSLAMVLQAVGHIPLPPYIDRGDQPADKERYQTVFARRDGAVAAPTAALHFDERTMTQLADAGLRCAFVTLHVGAGTFQPVRCDNIDEHEMHSEYIEVDAGLCNLVRETKKSGGRIVAVGTTSVRSLETASAANGWIEPYYGDTDIFIYPGYQFKTVDVMLTNFHLPESTLIMLVSAFAGRDKTLNAYREAVENQYRFFSYGDAMLIDS